MAVPERRRFPGELFDLAKILCREKRRRDHPRAACNAYRQARDNLWPFLRRYRLSVSKSNPARDLLVGKTKRKSPERDEL
jgi:hypothetical protein